MRPAGTREELLGLQVKLLELVLCLQQFPCGSPGKFAGQGFYGHSRGQTGGSSRGKAQC